ncbi:allene oxide synthase-lipoxygenase protein-like [Lingula anatina]|uniref:Allene oxide synthase-lipoxygenase protein-like n=1 Tax=Lingula anatina TaxID=7574 RepID=A0A1S3HMH4_LINAN|nr:allene oxide synthase-lipoxygenase protein-like [Lingula anatina]|eukprot:XP_013386239.1 allene oxide synthase-lipoxygenase protein-like [Lingula anatina]
MSSLLIRRLNLRAAFTSSSRGQRACVGELFKGGTRPRSISKGMGNHHSATLTTHVLQVKTGDRKGAGTDANVTVILHDDHGKKSSPLKLDHPLRDDLERGSLDVFPVAEPLKEFGKIQKIEFTMEKFGLASDWYVESVCIEDKRQESIIPYMFPIHRWIRPSRRYVFDHLDCKLPQDDQEIDQRKEELTEKRKIYELEQKAPGLPAQVKQIPDDEMFSDDYKWDIVKRKMALIAQTKLTHLATLFEHWDSYDDLIAVYGGDLEAPEEQLKYWRDDEWFGAQRLASCNPTLISLCTAIPQK